jgi:hypothetical protein
MSAQTLGGAVRTTVMGDGTGPIAQKMFLNSAPEGTLPPFATYNDDTSTTPSHSGDGKVLFYTRTIQIDIWQTVDNEDPSIPVTIRERLNGAVVDVVGMPNKMLLTVVSNNRIPEPIGTNVVHHEITVTTRHGSAVV